MATSQAVDSMILNLGCGSMFMPKAVNHDLWKHGSWVDVAHDLNVYPWPWPDNRFVLVYALDLIEHLDSFIGFFDECWRILAPNGRVAIRTPRWDSMNTFIDPTHKRGYHAESFDYLDPTTEWGSKYGMYTTRKWRKVEVIDDLNLHAILEVVK